VPPVCLAYKVTVGTFIKWTYSFTDDVRNGNRRPLNSRHTEVCHLQLNNCMCHGTHDTYIALYITVPAVLADSLLHCFLLRVGRDHVHIKQYVSESVQNCDASKQLLQGEKQQQFYVGGNFIALRKLLFLSRYSLFYIYFGNIFYLTLSSPS
jgi:hypothetical protein